MGYRIFYFCQSNGLLGRDLYQAFCAAGADVHVEEINFFHTPEGHLAEALNVREIIDKICLFRPDFVFSVEGKGADDDGLLAGSYALLGIPYVTWFVDDPPFAESFGKKYCPENTLALVFDEAYVPTLEMLGFINVNALPLAANTQRWAAKTDPHENEPAFNDNIVFVGKLATTQIKYLRNNLRQCWPELSLKIINAAVNDFLKYSDKGTESALDKNLFVNDRVIKCPSAVAWKLANSLIEKTASLEKRVSYASELCSLGLAVYGGDEWNRYLDPKYLKGPIDYYGERIKKLYHCSKINLNISKYQLRTTVNQRVFDVPAAGGFLLTDFKPELEDFFVIDKEVICFCNKDELKKKAVYYLEHENQRLQVIENARERVLKEHDYSKRIKKLFLWLAQFRCSQKYHQFKQTVKTDIAYDPVRNKLGHMLDVNLN